MEIFKLEFTDAKLSKNQIDAKVVLNFVQKKMTNSVLNLV